MTLKFKRSSEKNRSQAYLKIMKIEAESLYIIQQQTNFFKLLYSLKSSVKALPILNNIKKMGIFQRCIQNPVKHLRLGFSQKKITAKNSLASLRKDPSQTFGSVQSTPLYSSNYALAYLISKKHFTVTGKSYNKVLFQQIMLSYSDYTSIIKMTSKDK